MNLEVATFNNCQKVGLITVLVVSLLLFLLAVLANRDLVFENGDDPFVIASLTFASKLHLHAAYTVNLSITGNRNLYALHLSRESDLVDLESLESDFHEILSPSCVFSVKVYLNGNRIGSGSLSSCHHVQGWEGFLYLENEHYHITPNLPEDESPGSNSYGSLNHHRRYDRSIEFLEDIQSGLKVSPLKVVGHKLTKVKSSGKSEVRGSDSKRISSDARNKAYEEMLKDQENLEDETETEEKSSASQISSSERNGKVGRVVELAVFTDDAFYQKWATKFPTDTQKKINEFVLTLVNNMNYLYAQPTMKAKVSFRLVHIAVQKGVPGGLKPSRNGENYLDNFCVFAGQKDKNLWDHAMMISGLDLKDGQGQNLLGIAFSATMCLRQWSCSLVEFVKGFETAFTATHEIGHTLGMEHDGELQNKKCNPSRFMMAAFAGKGQINWSPCSNENIKTYFATGDPLPKKKAPKFIPKCLTKIGASKSRYQYRTKQLPGQIFTPKEQCETACQGCIPHLTAKSPYNNMCWMLHCKTPAKKIFAAHPALEGTACGPNKKKRCRNGKCQ